MCSMKPIDISSGEGIEKILGWVTILKKPEKITGFTAKGFGKLILF